MRGDQLYWLPASVFAMVSLVLLGAALLSTRVDKRALLIGARNGLLVALVVALLIIVPVTLITNGSDFLWATLDLGDAFMLGLLLGIPLSIGYFWLGLTLVSAGLLFGAQRSWATRGAWVAAPVVAVVLVSSAGFALGMVQRAGEPTIVTRPGQLDLHLQGAIGPALSASGPAGCEASSAGSFSVVAGEDSAAPLVVACDGPSASVQLTIRDDTPALLMIQLGELTAAPGKGWEPGEQTTRLAPGWTYESGELHFNGLVPLHAENGEPIEGRSWQGTLRWTCPD